MKKDEMDAKLVELLKTASQCSCIKNGEYCSQCVEPIKTVLRQSLVKEVEKVGLLACGEGIALKSDEWNNIKLKILQEKE